VKILFVGDKWDYGDRARGLSFEYDTFYRTLEHDGHDVALFDVGEIRGLQPGEIESKLRTAVEERRPEVVFCFLFETEIAPALLARVRDEDGVPVVNWFPDDHWRYDDFSRSYAPALSLSVTTSSAAAARYEEDGFPHLMSQWGYADKVFGATRPVDKPSGTLVFVGQPYGDRAKALGRLGRSLPTGSSVELYGFGTPNGRITPARMFALFNESAGSINFASSWQPGLLSRLRRGQVLPRRIPSQLKARVFEVSGAGGLLLTEPSEDLGRYFTAGEEIVVFENVKELSEAAIEALTNDAWRLRVASAGFERCHREHTMSLRLQAVLEAVT
jgi:spore maturation protein CgeB